MTLICRLCLNEASTYGFSMHYTDDDGLTTTILVKALVPELCLSLSVNPVVCKSCYYELRKAYVFRQQCLRSENLINIFIRETKNKTNTIILKNVVDFWRRRNEKPAEVDGHLEWIGKTKDQLDEPIILNRTASLSNRIENVVGLSLDEQNDLDIDNVSQHSLGSEPGKEEIVGCTCGPSNTRDCLFCKFDTSTGEKEKSDQELNTDDHVTMVIDDVVSNFDDFIANACLDKSEIPSSAVPTTSPDATFPIRTYAKKHKVVPKQIDQEVCRVDEPKQITSRINLVGDLNDQDISNLIEELQKDENLKKLGLNEDGDHTQETYELRKFIDRSDNSISFALIPKTTATIRRRLDTNKDVINPQIATSLQSGVKIQGIFNVQAIANVQDGINKHLDRGADKGGINAISLNLNKDQIKSSVTPKEKVIRPRNDGNNGQDVTILQGDANVHDVTNVQDLTGDDNDGNNGQDVTILQGDANVHDVTNVQDLTGDDVKSSMPSEKNVGSNGQDVTRVQGDANVLTTVQDLMDNYIKSCLTPEKNAGNNRQDVTRVQGDADVHGVATVQDLMEDYIKSSMPPPEKNVGNNGHDIIDTRTGDGLDAGGNSHGRCGDQEISGKGSENVTEENASSKNSEGIPMLSPLTEPIDDGSQVPENSRDSSLGNPESMIKGIYDDEESLGIIRFPPNPDNTDHPEDSLLPSASTTDKPPVVGPMPMIRVRPASALQKVRTLNHELWPQAPGYSDIEASLEIPPNIIYKVPTKVVEHQPGKAPIVLNSKLGPTDPLMNIESSNHPKNLPIFKRYYRKIAPAKPTRFLRRVLNPLTLKPIEELCKTGDIQLLSPNSRQLIVESTKPDVSTPVRSEDGVKSSPKNREGVVGSRDEEVYDAIDIKDEPLDCTESDVLMNFGTDDDNSQPSNDSEGEKTRSASETSFMDAIPQNDLVKSIVDNIPEVGEEQFDEPEYVHINNVTFSDLAKLVDESKKHMEKTQPQSTKPSVKSYEKVTPFCFVPSCPNNTKRNPSKFFVGVPWNPAKQKLWCEAVGITFPDDGSRFSCCEDHFDLEHDMKNYTTFKQSGCPPVMKKGILPNVSPRSKKTETPSPNTDSEHKDNDATFKKPLEPSKSQLGKSKLNRGKVRHKGLRDALAGNDSIHKRKEERKCDNGDDVILIESPVKHIGEPQLGTNELNREKERHSKLGDRVAANDSRHKCKEERKCDSGNDVILIESTVKCSSEPQLDTNELNREKERHIMLGDRVDAGHKCKEQCKCDNGDDVILIESPVNSIVEHQLSTNELNRDKRRHSKLDDTVAANDSGHKCKNEPTYDNGDDVILVESSVKHIGQPQLGRNELNKEKERYLGANDSGLKCKEERKYDDDDDVILIEPPVKLIGRPELGINKLNRDMGNTDACKKEKSSKQFYQVKHCFVPGCKNTSMNCPTKIFLNVPSDKEAQKIWFKRVGLLDSYNAIRMFCCEEHFDIENDMANYKTYKMSGGNVVLKQGVIPSKRLPFRKLHPDPVLDQALPSADVIMKEAPHRHTVEPGLTIASERTIEPEATVESHLGLRRKTRTDKAIPQDVVRYCFVTDCTNNSMLCPNKRFVMVPMDTELQKTWFQLAGRQFQQSHKTYYCCEDHFTVEMVKRYLDCGPDVAQNCFNTEHEITMTEWTTKKARIVDNSKAVVGADSKPPEPEIFTPQLARKKEATVENSITTLNTNSEGPKPNITLYIKKRFCFVPNCIYSGISAPLQKYIRIPVDEQVQKRWFKAVGRTWFGVKENVWCCKDHFSKSNLKRYEVFGSKIFDEKWFIPFRSPFPEVPGETSKEPTTTSKESTTTSKKPTTTSEEPKTTSKEPKTTSKEPKTMSKEPTTTSKETQTTSKEPKTTSEEPKTIVNTKAKQRPDHDIVMPFVPPTKNRPRCCFVPECKHSLLSTPSRYYVRLPFEEPVQKRLFELVGRPFDGVMENVWCCDDHFDKKNMERYEVFGSQIFDEKRFIPPRSPFPEVPGATSKEPATTSKDPKTTCKEPKTTSKDPKATSKEPKATSKEPKTIINTTAKRQPNRDMVMPLVHPTQNSNKCCFVPECKNSSLSTPLRYYVRLPLEEQVQKRLFERAGRPFGGVMENVWCCDDHFDDKLIKTFDSHGHRVLDEDSFVPDGWPPVEVGTEKEPKTTSVKIKRFCFVPNCKSNTVSIPLKNYIKVPVDDQVQKRWFKAVGRQWLGVKENVWCCSDHFNKTMIKMYEHSGDNILHDKWFIPRCAPHPDVPDVRGDDPNTTVNAHPKPPNSAVFKTLWLTAKHKPCFVPDCKQSSISDNEKLLVGLPTIETVQKQWFDAVGREYSGVQSDLWCCEDHFNIKKDMKMYCNGYMYIDIGKIKGAVLPRKLKRPMQQTYLPGVLLKHLIDYAKFDITDLEPKNLASKNCFVPDCLSSAYTCPDKVFIAVPKEMYGRIRWFSSIQRRVPNYNKPYYCCEDHFEIKEHNVIDGDSVTIKEACEEETPEPPKKKPKLHNT